MLTQLLNHISSSTNSEGFRGLRFIHEINNFPAFYIHAARSSISHIGADRRFRVHSISVRGYTYNGDPELYARQLEAAIQSFSEAQEARVLSLETDEGLMAPYAIIDISAQILEELI